MVLCGNAPSSERNPGTKVPYTSSVSRIRSGRFFNMPPILPIVSSLKAFALGLPGLHRKNALTFGSSNFDSSFVLNWKRSSCFACTLITFRS